MAKCSAASISSGGGRRRLLGSLAAAVCCAAFVGCSKSPHELAPVAGRVVIDGQPFTQGKVMFAPIAAGESRESGRAAFGRLGADGSFQLGTYEDGDGAVVGEHWVTVIQITPKDAPKPAAGPLAFTRVAVPTKVAVAADQENRIDVTLTQADVAKYGVFDD
jgi:hypothetical protein